MPEHDDARHEPGATASPAGTVAPAKRDLRAGVAGGALRARVFPNLGHAAREAGELVPYATWCAFNAIDPEGSGRIAFDVARDLIVEWRRIDAASARRILRAGAVAGYWHIDAGCVYLTSVARLLVRFGLEHERAPHLVPLRLMRTVAAIRAHIFATAREIPGHAQRFKNAPLSRGVLEQITRVPTRTQRRYDAAATILAQQTYAKVERAPGSGIALVGEGYFVGRGEVQWRRLADYRVPRGHVRASRSAAAHAVRKARAVRGQQEGRDPGCSPVVVSRGFSPEPGPPPTRRFYSAASEANARERARREHPDREAMIGWGKAGGMRVVSLEEAL